MRRFYLYTAMLPKTPSKHISDSGGTRSMSSNLLGIRSRWIVGGVVVLAGVLLSACGSSPTLEPTSEAPPSSPATASTAAPAAATSTEAPALPATIFGAETKWYIEPNSEAKRQADAWRASRPEDAAQMEKIAAQPQADWFGDWSGDISSTVAGRVAQIRGAGALPVFVAYNIPARDCGLYSSGGVNSPEAYRTWIDGFAAGIGDQPAVVVLEPDALAGITCLTPANQEIRYDLIAYAVKSLAARPHAAVYVDAGHSDWVPAAEMAKRLKRAGITQAAGFALNVSNFQPTPDLIAYGKAVATAIDPQAPPHFVIDTSRNGLGPFPKAEDPTGESWCNPPGRALGEPPTTHTADPLADAYLWIKSPGESDGTCKNGPAAGVWWPEYALGLAQRAK
jgi:endoglucanase